ncbi:TIGR04255 family protein [Bradyrhizobium sediminis]|uniref:TIGR04255 family protein n=1 Tax=Bradyrhizobium sediminis TaxID=2840469 RepID=A0A975NJA5_9BRAD|nr:TIGR04255 family protein [Bradyrhizobium sediminis]QWG15124.1 TIGR04255 family protein [Bradyrhizobium sediminis]
MGKKMNNAPVYYALAQVKFNTLAALATYVPAIQENLRKAGYPDFQTIQLAHLELIGAPVPKTTVATRYLFLNSRKTAGFILDQSWLTYQTTDYDTFEPFLSAFLFGLQAIHKEAVLNYSERVGVRYLDAVLPNANESVTDYLQPCVLGLSGSFPDRSLVHTLSETRTVLDKTTLVSRAIVHTQQDRGAAFPEDLQPIHLTLIAKFAQVTGQYAIIDTDGWMEDRQDFDLDRLATTLDSLHKNIGRSFEKMVTPHALKVWD